MPYSVPAGEYEVMVWHLCGLALLFIIVALVVVLACLAPSCYFL